MVHLVTRLLMMLIIGIHFVGVVSASDPAPHHAADSSSAEAHGDGGLPMKWTRDLALFSLITFVVYVAVLRVGAWGLLRDGLNERERRIRQDIADAEANRAKSEAMVRDHEARMLKVHDEVREILAEARRDADHVKQEIVATAQTEAEATKQRAIAEIERSRDAALTELFDFVSNNVVNATEKVVKESLAELNIRRN
jgi:F-type H+-transporting ATPase subunit b